MFYILKFCPFEPSTSVGKLSENDTLGQLRTTNAIRMMTRDNSSAIFQPCANSPNLFVEVIFICGVVKLSEGAEIEATRLFGNLFQDRDLDLSW